MKKIPVRKLVRKDFLQCPNCGWKTPDLYGRDVNGRTVYQCSRCHEKFTQEQIETLWKTVPKKVYAYRCEGCGEYIPNTSENRNMLGVFNELLCPTCNEGKGNILSLKLVAINGHHASKLRTMTAESYITPVKTRKHQIILRYLNILAKIEQTSWRKVPQRGIQAYITTLEGPIGYLAYTKDEGYHGLPVIRQLFVVKEERRKGHATRLVKHFLTNQCEKPDKKGCFFLIESPNDASLRLFQKLGYVRIEDKEIRFINCYWIQCL